MKKTIFLKTCALVNTIQLAWFIRKLHWWLMWKLTLNIFNPNRPRTSGSNFVNFH